MPMSTGYSRQVDYYENACDNPPSAVVTSTWKMIDTTLSDKYPDARVSGGIFLYPRQASLLTTLIEHITSHVDSRQHQVTLCETGFGSGHSLVLFANAPAKHPMRILSFDKFDRPYQLDLWNILNTTIFPNHSLDYVAGDSCKTVPATLSQENLLGQCDILHGSSLCASDNIDLVENSPCGALLTSTAMNSLEDKAVYFGPNAQWRKLRDRGCITQPVCFQEAPLQLDRTLVFGKQGQWFTSGFCVAMVTGKCSRHQSLSAPCRSEIALVMNTIGLDRFCPRYQIPAPS